jgi:hypothetical protein
MIRFDEEGDMAHGMCDDLPLTAGRGTRLTRGNINVSQLFERDALQPAAPKLKRIRIGNIGEDNFARDCISPTGGMDNKFLSDPIFGRVQLMLNHGLNERIRVGTFFTQIHLPALIVNLIPHNPHVKNFENDLHPVTTLLKRTAPIRRFSFYLDFYLDFEEVFLRGTFAPDLRALESPMATACFRLFTFFPDLPLFKVPFLRSRIAFSTSSPAFLPYFAMLKLLSSRL